MDRAIKAGCVYFRAFRGFDGRPRFYVPSRQEASGPVARWSRGERVSKGGVDMSELKSLWQESGATFNEERTHRYVLWRSFTADPEPRRMAAFIGLNPSTADEITNDRTVKRCIDFARSWGHHGMFMLNLFGFRATDPTTCMPIPNRLGTETTMPSFVFVVRSVGLSVAGESTAHTWTVARKLLSYFPSTVSPAIAWVRQSMVSPGIRFIYVGMFDCNLL